jgi:hypothetical protein
MKTIRKTVLGGAVELSWDPSANVTIEGTLWGLLETAATIPPDTLAVTISTKNEWFQISKGPDGVFVSASDFDQIDCLFPSFAGLFQAFPELLVVKLRFAPDLVVTP